MSEGKQVNIVVCYTTESGEFWIDYDTTVARFQDGEVWTVDEQEWEKDDALTDSVYDALEKLFRTAGKVELE
jgi:hypothetical protein